MTCELCELLAYAREGGADAREVFVGGFVIGFASKNLGDFGPLCDTCTDAMRSAAVAATETACAGTAPRSSNASN